MEKFDVYLYNIPKVSEDGMKSLPIEPHRTQEFSGLDEAKKFGAEQKGNYDRVVLIQTTRKDDAKEEELGEQKMIERYIEGTKE